MVDLIIDNGVVRTLDGAGTVARAVAIQAGRIVAVGDRPSIADLAGSSTTIIDAGGRTVVPGLVDGHAHMDREGLKSALPSLAGVRSIDDVLERISELAAKAAPGEWICTMPLGDPPEYGGLPTSLREQRYPNRWDLDQVAPDNPVYIRAIWGYWRHRLPLISIANSEALRRAGIDRSTTSPLSTIEIDIDDAGEPTGIFIEWSPVPTVELTLMEAAPRFTHGDRVKGLERSMRAYNSVGTTTVFEGHGVADEVLHAYQDVRSDRRSTVRAHLTFSPSFGCEDEIDLSRLFGPWGGWLRGRGLGDDFLCVAGVCLEPHRTAEDLVRARAMPYTGWAGFSYDAGIPRSLVGRFLGEAATWDIRVATMVPELLADFERVNSSKSIASRRWVLGHLRTTNREQVSQMSELGIAVTTHTNRYLYKQSEQLADELGPDKEDTIVPLRALYDAGIPISFGTDNSPISVFRAVWHAVSRRGRETGRVVGPEQRLTRDMAMRVATMGGAKLVQREHQQGSLEIGKFGDVVVLSADPWSVAEEELPEIVADVTIVGGSVVYDRSETV